MDEGKQSPINADFEETEVIQMPNGTVDHDRENNKKMAGPSNLMNCSASDAFSENIPNGEIEDYTGNGEISSPSTSPEELRNDIDTSKAVTFAEELEVYDLSHDKASHITISLQTPVHFIDQHSSSVYSNQEEVHLNHSDGLTFLNKDLDAVNKKNGFVEESTENTADSQIRPISVQRPSELSLTKASDITEELKNEETVIAEQPAIVETGDNEVIHDSEPTVPQADEATHKEFTVHSVDEAELVKDYEAGNTRLTTKTSPLEDVHPLFERALSSHSDGVSHSTDSNNWDTIGPLDNPAFLKTLQYSVSQPFDQDEHFGLQSTLDLESQFAVQDPPDLDKGWAWVVLTAAFVASALIGATVYAAGVLMSAILKSIDPDLTKASWVGSVNVCAMCISGPFVGTVLKRFGARLTVFCAGIVVSVGFIGASLSTNITQLILTHGLIAGIGAGYTINPMFVSVGQYFNKYRGLACGLLATGAGAGMLTGGTFIAFLLSNYGLSGTYLIWAGMTFHITPIGLLLRPSPEERLRALEEEIIGAESQQEYNSQPDLASEHNSLNSFFGSVNQSMVSGMDKISQKRKSPGLRNISKMSGGDPDAHLLKTVLHYEISRSNFSISTVATNRSCPRSHMTSPAPHKPTRSPSHAGQQLMSISSSPADTPTATSPITVPSLSQYTLSTTVINSPNVITTHHTSMSTLTPAITTPNYPPSSPTSTYGPLSRLQHNRLSMGSQSQYTSMSHISRRLSLKGSLHPSHTGELDNESITSALVSQLRPMDTIAPRHPLSSRSISTLMGSIASFPTALAIVKDDLSRFEEYGTPNKSSKSLKDYIISILDSLRLLRNKPFLVFLLTCFFWAFGESPIQTYLPSYAISRGTTPMQASFLYTAMGIGSILGRFLSGLIATDHSVGPILLHTGCLGVAGLLSVASPLITATVIEQMMFASLLGIYTGALVPLTSLITIEMLGIGELGLGFGFISMSQGVGYLIGPPLSSVIVNSIGYRKAFIFSGGVLLIASLITLSISLLLKNRGEGEEDYQDQHSLIDLEKVVQKISDRHIKEEEAADNFAKDKPEENVKTLTGSVSTLTEIQRERGSTTEGSGELSRHVEHYTGEDKLDPIMEVVGK